MSFLFNNFYYSIMSSIEIQDGENVNEWTNWIEEAIAKEHIRYYDYDHFSNIQEIGSGAFGRVFRANRRNPEQYFALKSFFNLDNTTVKEIVYEVIIEIGNFPFGFFIL